MRGLIILCFVAVAAAAPQGYNYPSQSNGQFAIQAGAASSSGFQNLGGAHNHHQQQPLVSKRFFIHSAPEEKEVEIQHRDIFVGTARKNFNVVFIKSPIAKQQQTKIRVIPAVNEEKTAIYVLAKKAENAQVVAHVEEPATTTTKPEVFFIKYKTNEEAEHAQHSIQAQYDHLGGSTSISNEGISPVSSVIGSLDGFQQGGSGVGFGGAAGSGFGAVSGSGFSAATGADFGVATGAGFASAGVGSGHGASSSAYLPPVKKH